MAATGNFVSDWLISKKSSSLQILWYFVDFLLDFRIVQILWYFVGFLLDFGTVQTLWYFVGVLSEQF
jgi:ammonia channel protein AmtB